MSSWGVSDFFSVETTNVSQSTQRNGSTPFPSSAPSSSSVAATCGFINDREQSNGVDRRRDAASSRGVKRKQSSTLSASNPPSQDCDRRPSSSSSSASIFGRKSSFGKHPSFESSSSSTNSSFTSRGQLWADRHAPSTADQLSVHAKKVQEVRQWLQTYYSQNGYGSRVMSPFLLLTGPAGCGKSATVKALAADMRIGVSEWTNPSDTRSREEERELDQLLLEGGGGGGNRRWYDGGEATAFQPSQLATFSDFLLRTNKYRALPIAIADDSTSSSSSSSSSSTLILLDEFPNAFLRDPSPFHRLLEQYSRRHHAHPIVFVVSNSNSSSSSGSVMLKLFPKAIQTSLEIATINFNAVAATFVASCLKKISAKEAGADSSLVAVNAAQIDAIVINANGDLRAAINTLQFQSLRVTSSAFKESLKLSQSSSSSSSRAASKSQKTSKSGSKASESGQKDSCLFLFHALGKILHCKRDPSTPSTPSTASKNPSTSTSAFANGSSTASSTSSTESVEKPLPKHHVRHFRDPLQCVPEDVVAKSAVSGDMFNLYLHQNYPEYFVGGVEDVAAAAEYLSLADSLTAAWTTKEAMIGYEASLATRAILFCNSAKAKAADGGGSKNRPSTQKSGAYNKSSSGFRPTKKPQWFDVWRRRRERLSVLSSAFRELRETPANLVTVVLPAIKASGKELPSSTQNQTMKDVTTFPKGSFGGFPSSSSSSAQLLKEGEVVGDEEEEEEGERRGVISLPAMEGAERTEENADMARYDDDLVDIDDDE